MLYPRENEHGGGALYDLRFAVEQNFDGESLELSLLTDEHEEAVADMPVRIDVRLGGLALMWNVAHDAVLPRVIDESVVDHHVTGSGAAAVIFQFRGGDHLRSHHGLGELAARGWRGYFDRPAKVFCIEHCIREWT